MDKAKRELLFYRISSGSVRLILPNKTYVLKKPNVEDLYLACELHDKVLRDSEYEGLYSDEELLSFMIENDLWNEELQNLLQKLPKEIEEFKLNLFKSVFKSNERKTLRKAIAIAKEKFSEVFEKRNCLSHLSCSGAASTAKSRYIMGCSLYNLNGKRVFGDEEAFWNSDASTLDDLFSAYSKVRITEQEFRELARTEPWRNIWGAHKAEGRLFGIPATEYSEEQISLVNWSSLFDNVFQHPDCPKESVIEDDDMLDGWMIDQRRQREDRLTKKEGEFAISNPKIAGSQEIFIPAETAEDAKKVFNLNDDFAKAVQRQKFKLIKEKGVVNEVDMPDVKMRLMMQKNNM